MRWYKFDGMEAGFAHSFRSGRYVVLWCLFSSLALPVQAQMGDTQHFWQFQVMSGEREIGTHRFEVEKSGSKERVLSDADFRVRLLFVDVFRYVHQSREQWEDNCLTTIESNTKANRERFAVKGSIKAGGFQLENQKQTLARCVQTFAYWNPDILEASQLLNAQTGELEDVSVSYTGEETFVLRDTSIQTKRYRLSLQEGHIDLWYDKSSDVWVGLETLSPGGDPVRYIATRTPLESA